MPRDLLDFLNLHPGETAWLFGKGPSLDGFDFAAAGPLRVAINDVVGRVPGCVYGFANDSVADWAHVYQPGLVLFQPRRLEHDIHAARCPVACERVIFDDELDDERLAWPPARLALIGLSVRRGTLGSAGQILRVMGVRRVVCVGIDGGGRHASGHWHTRLRHDHAADYNSIRDAFVTASRIQGLDVVFHGADLTTQLPNGMITIKILENTFIRGVPVRAGEIVEAAPSDAAILIAERRAVAWNAPAPVSAQAPIEAAAAAPVSEQAVARPAAKPRRAGHSAKPAAS